MSAIPPIEPPGPTQRMRVVHRRKPDDDEGNPSPGSDEQSNRDQPDGDELDHDDDGGLPHVDIRV